MLPLAILLGDILAVLVRNSLALLLCHLAALSLGNSLAFPGRHFLAVLVGLLFRLGLLHRLALSFRKEFACGRVFLPDLVATTLDPVRIADSPLLFSALVFVVAFGNLTVHRATLLLVLSLADLTVSDLAHVVRIRRAGFPILCAANTVSYWIAHILFFFDFNDCLNCLVFDPATGRQTRSTIV